ncbi:MAG TPA: Fe-S cluster assembly protein SufD [Chitinophagaceae bacterium]|nr:Fe-S cluster assembly protein SufD [Chitinophagaceae bacterium]HML57344.1 Fe-S cluster assembly protein SufD [Ferruginibacter sp.]
MTPQVTLPIYDELLKDFAKLELKPEHESIRSKRKKALELFKLTGFPTRKHEDWKYTAVTPYLQSDFRTNGSVPVAPVAVDYLKLAAIPGLDCYRVVLVNGALQSVDDALPPNVKVRSMAEAQEDAGLLKYFGSVSVLDKAPFAALNTALFANGFFLEIDAQANLEKPIHLVQVLNSDAQAFVQPRNLVVVHTGAKATVIESVVSTPGTKVFANSLTEVVLKENAHLQHYLLQMAEKDTQLIQQNDVSQQQHSVYSNYTFSLPGSSLIRNNLNVALDAQQTETHLYGLYLGRGNQLIDNHSLVDHKMPHCNSNEMYKGVLMDQSTGVFNGKVFVQQDAQKTNAFQQNNNLLLSDEATINSKPQLEIFADDVKCSHGSTVGQLSRESMFYLQSRGISEQSARAMLVNAFAFDVTEKIAIPQLEKFINQKITANIPALN